MELRARASFVLAVVLSSYGCTETGAGGPDGAAPDGGVARVDAGGGGDANAEAAAPGGAIDPTPDELASRGACPAPGGAGVAHQGAVVADETWAAAASPHRVPENLEILATVTLEACAVVEVAPGRIVTVGATGKAGRLVARGTAALVDGKRDVRPVTIRSADPAARWGKLLVLPTGTVDLTVAAIQDGGGATSDDLGALVVQGVARGTNDGDVTRSARVDRVLVERSGSYGVNLEGWGAFAEGSTKLWIRGGGSPDHPSAVRLEPGVAATLPAALAATGNVRDEILVATRKTFLRTDTLVARGLPYRVLGPVYVAPAADGPFVKLTVEAGVTVAFDANGGSGITVGSTDKREGALVAVGTPAAPIVFTSAKATKAPGDWMSLYFRYHRPGESRIDHARVEYAGGESGASGFGCGPGDNDGALFVQGRGPDDAAPAATLVDHTAFSNIGGTTVIVSGWTDASGPNLTNANTFGPGVPACKVSKPKRAGGGDVCDGDRRTCW